MQQHPDKVTGQKLKGHNIIFEYLLVKRFSRVYGMYVIW